MNPRAIADGALEVSIVGSFSRIGPAVRGRLYGWRQPPPGALRGKTALVTGPTSGLGRATAGELARLGARIVLVGRSRERLEQIRAELVQKAGEDRFPFVVADLSSLSSVRRAIDRIGATEERLDVLVDSAGAIFPERTLSPDGIEATLALLVVGPFALTRGLLPLLRASADARVIAVASGGMYTQAVDLDDLAFDRIPYSGPRAYARAKRIQVALVREWARRLAGEPITVTAMHPGWADTPGLAHSLPGFHRVMRPLLRTAEQGIDTITWLATAEPAPPAGRLYLDRRPRPFDRIPGTRLTGAERARLWNAVSQMAAA